MPDDYKETTPSPETQAPSPFPMSDAGRSSMQGAMEEARAEQAQQEREGAADAAALDTKHRSAPGVGSEKVEGTPEWVDRGIQDVPVGDLPQPDGVTAENFDHHITHDDAVKAMQEYQNMRPLTDQGYTGDDFAAADQAKGLDYAHGQQRIYDLFHGSNAIHVTKDGDQYDIIDGRHRVFVAKELGIDTLPARVREKIHH